MKTAFILLLMFAPGVPAQNSAVASGNTAQSGWPLQNADICRGIENSAEATQFQMADARISSPPDFRTRVPHPQFELTSIARTSDLHLLMASLRCRVRSECRSFLVAISLAGMGDHDAAQLLTRLARRPGATRRQRVSSDGPILISPQRVALLVIEEDGLRITQAVQPSRPARLGEVVGVLDRASHRSLLARVIGPGKLAPVAQKPRLEAAR
jgi:hypothetical protein